MKTPGSEAYVPLSETTQLPPGTEVDVTHGAVLLQAVANCPGVAFFGDGDGVLSRFLLTGQTACRAIVRLVGGDFGVCKKAERKASGSRSLSAEEKKRRRGKPIRRLWGKGTGAYRTRGRYSAGTVRGTFWLTADFCGGTLTTVRTGAVAVRDFVKKKTIIVKAGKSYFARPAKRTA